MGLIKNRENKTHYVLSYMIIFMILSWFFFAYYYFLRVDGAKKKKFLIYIFITRGW